MKKDPIIIIGTGLAGYSLAKEFRKANSSQPLIIISKDQGHFYSKPLLSTAFSYKRSVEDLHTADAKTMAKQLDAKILTHTTVTKIDSEKKSVSTDKGQSYQYDKLVLAVGADPIIAPIKGEAAQDILSVNDLTDYALLRKSLDGKKHITILGAGLVGCEFANDLAHAGHSIDVIALSERPIDHLLPHPIGLGLQKALSEMGVQWHFKQAISNIEKKDASYLLQLSNGETLFSDLVLSAIGLKPRLSLAEMANVKTTRAITVNSSLQTSDPDIYALGDCAEVDGLLLLYVAPILQCSRALAKTLNGEETPVKYPTMPIVVKTPAFPNVVCPPPSGADGGWVTEGDYPDIKAIYQNKNQEILGFALSGKMTKERLKLTQALVTI